MDTTKLKTFAQKARKTLIEETTKKLDFIMQSQTPEALEQKKTLIKYGFGDTGTTSGKQLRGNEQSKSQLIEKIAYTWFNRLCALRYMDMKGYTDCGIITEKEGFTQPEILTEAKNGTLPAGIEAHTDMATLHAILSGQTGVPNRDEAAYRLLLKGACNYYHTIMPFMFEPINDYTEILLMDDCLSENSLLADLKEALDEENCRNVEVIGWLYQYYISEKKEEIDKKVNSGKKVGKQELSVKTTQYTNDWIVKYLVDNSLGRILINKYPEIKAKISLDYYSENEDHQFEGKNINLLEEIEFCDPACGSGHMLTRAFDLFYIAYQEQGYSAKETVKNIIGKNLYGMEISGRAGSLAAFALFMKAKEKYKRFFSHPTQPNICVFEDITIFENDSKEATKEIEPEAQDFISYLSNISNFGSLVKIDFDKDVFLEKLHKMGQNQPILYKKYVPKIEEYISYLSKKFDVISTNPPFLGKAMDDKLSEFAKNEYPKTKKDTFAMFMERCFEYIKQDGICAIVTMESWMFLSGFEKFRKDLIKNRSIISMMYMEKGVMGIAFGTSATVFQKVQYQKNSGTYYYIQNKDLEEKNLLKLPETVYKTEISDFKKIPGYPIAYWVSDRFRDLFKLEKKLGDVASPRQGMATSDNKRFLRFWQEVSINRVGFGFSSRDEAKESGLKWFPYNKGGAFRKWYGNNEYLVNWENDGYEIRNFYSSTGKLLSRPQNTQFYFKEGITWSSLSSSRFASRFSYPGFLFDSKGPCLFPFQNSEKHIIINYVNSKISDTSFQFIAPTLDFTQGALSKLPYKPITNPTTKQTIEETAQALISLSKDDWDAYERSWDFKRHPLLAQDIQTHLLETGYKNLRQNWQAMTDQMKELEEANNELFINHYGLVGELDKAVPLREISLTCNPHYRYPPNRSNPFDPKKAEKRLREDTVKELISYGVGCVFGRYALDKDGLILASQGESLDDYFKQIPQPSFMPDEDNAVPILEENWFADDLYARLEEFLKVAFGAEHLRDNLAFIKKALGKDLQKYLLKDFIKDHVQTYNNRPIYWLFSSPKKYFNLLIYMHRYTSSTLSVVLKYLREFKDKVNAEIESYRNLSVNASDSAEKTRALKTLDKYSAIVRDLEEYENKTIFPLASERIEIDLDDGVAVNYPKFGDALYKIKGVNG